MSKFRERREAFRQRAEQGIKEREKGGAKYSCINLGGMEVNWFKPGSDKVKRNCIDIIPFFATQDWIGKMKTYNGVQLNVKPGDMLYKLEVPVHSQVGAEKRTFLCLNFSLGKSCPICDERESIKEGDDSDDDPKFGKKGKEDFIKSLYPQWRVYYNIRDKNEEEKGKRRKVWDASYHNFEKLFLDDADMGEKGYIIYADPDEGKTIRFRGRLKKFKTMEYVVADSIEFLDRKKQYDEDDIKRSVPFDKYLVIPTYEEVQKAYLGIDNDDTLEKERGRDKEEDSDDDND